MKAEIIPREAGSLAAIERDPYQAAMLTWLEGKADNTRRSYMAGLRDFLDYTGEHPSETEALDVAGWKEDLKRRGMADATVAQRLSAISSYYTYLVKQGIHERNPVDAVGRNDLEVNPYERAHKLPLKAFRRILDVIPTETEIGARDRALLLFYVLCARRRSEVVGLRREDLRIEPGKVTYRAKLKGGKSKWKELPPPIWEAIRHYLDLDGRDPKGDEPIFVPTTDAGQYLREYYGAPEPEGPEPLTGEAVAQALKRHAAAAGLDPDTVTVHSLRHLGAELFQEASGNLRETQHFLDHARLDTTAIYMRQLTGEEHRHWQAMANALGV
jgi:integrase/recombinase XerD